MTELPTRAAELYDRLYTALFGTWKGPKRASRMTGRADQARKYIDIPDYSFSHAHFDAHLSGRETYAGTLGVLGTAWSGCKDYDDADDAEIVAALAAAAAKGITAGAFLFPGAPGEHSGGHLWTFYDHDYPIPDIRAQLRTIPRSRKGEDYPSGNPIRIPFGYHKLKRTRGTLILQNGRRFDLDNPDQLIAGIEALVSLPRNAKPQPMASGDARAGGAAWGDAYTPDQWKHLPDGGPLWHSAYIAAAAERRPDLAKLLRDERVTIVKKDDTRDDTDSAQVAALAYNLLSADVCKPQARAIADYLYSHLRPGRTREHYRAHFDAELERYTPTHYRPKEIRYTGAARHIEPLPPAEYTPEPKSRARNDRPQQVAGAAGYLAWLHTQIDAQSGSVMLSQAQCAARIGCCVRTIKRYEKALGTQIERRIFAQRQAGCLFLLTPDVVPTSPRDVVIADATIAQQRAENAQPATMQVEHSPPVVPSSPAAPPALRDIARLFFSVEVDPDTGEIWDRHTFARFKRFAARRGTYSDVRLVQVFTVEQKRVRFAKQDAKLEAKVRTMRLKPLEKKSRDAASKFEAYSRTGDKRAGVWRTIAGIYAAEEERRSPAATEPTTRELWAEVDQEAYQEARQQLRKTTARLATRTGGGACVPPNPAPAGASRPGDTLIANLFARHAAL